MCKRGQDERVTLDGVGPGDVAADISVMPTFTRSGGVTFVRWLSTEAHSCTLTGTNGDTWSALWGEEETSPITQETDYTLSCQGFDGSTVTDTATVRITPEWEEF